MSTEQLITLLDGVSEFTNVDSEKMEIAIAKTRFLVIEGWEFRMITQLMKHHDFDLIISK